MTLDLWNEQQNFNETYTECERINRMIRDFQSTGRTMSGLFIKDNDYGRNDRKNPFVERTVSMGDKSKTAKKPSKYKKLKCVLTVGGVVGVGYLGYKYIYKPLKKEYDAMLDRVIVKCESEQPMDGRIRRLTPLEQLAFDHKYGRNQITLDPSQYEIHESED